MTSEPLALGEDYNTRHEIPFCEAGLKSNQKVLSYPINSCAASA